MHLSVSLSVRMDVTSHEPINSLSQDYYIYVRNEQMHGYGTHKDCHNKHYVHGSVHHKSTLMNVQRDATICSLYILLQNHSTCFGCRTHSSSGVYKTVVTATGTSHMIVQLPQSEVANLAMII